MKRPIETNLLEDLDANSEAIRRVFGKAVRHAIMEHKCAGNPIATWQDGKVVWVAAKDIVLPPEIDADTDSEITKIEETA